MSFKKDAQRTNELEAALIEYAEKYGLTEKARLALSRDPWPGSPRVSMASMATQLSAVAMMGLHALLSRSQDRE